MPSPVRIKRRRPEQSAEADRLGYHHQQRRPEDRELAHGGYQLAADAVCGFHRVFGPPPV